MKRTDSDTSSQQLQAMYESLPYPARDPEDERKRLVRTGLDFLPKISHYGFAGQLDPERPFRALIAGGGTGDSAIYLAEQLRSRPAELVYVDFSRASMAIAQQRAAVRQLSNIQFVHASLLALDELALQPFDYINCSGVLHHLPDPLAGLCALRDQLKPEGVLGLMVYAQYGRTAIYQVQELMRLVAGQTDQPTRLSLTWKMLDSLPETHWLKRSAELHTDHERYGDAGLADLFLNPIDRAYTVPELYEWLDQARLDLIAFADHPLAYQPEYYIQDPVLLSAVRKKTQREQQAIAELMSGTLIKHTFYAAKTARKPAALSDSVIPIAAIGFDLEAVKRQLTSGRAGSQAVLENPDNSVKLPINPISTGFFSELGQGLTVAQLTGRLGEIPALRSAPPHWVRQQLAGLCDLLVKTGFIHYSEFDWPSAI